ncbi:hypothetical protein HMPREF9104_00964 [Lentilactobacillus kisonensis F0435]|uniref:Uncharacterized protein n=1 Tax=Lentilactobacillus kisonensis F0435 TaxID=797516 RepID=H1LED8_9LACO|nr:hypothetical protein HMPREF9104_00964 [Lentilactobacillus kisonensis F0435]
MQTSALLSCLNEFNRTDNTLMESSYKNNRNELFFKLFFR